MQVTTVLLLRITFKPSVALYLWQSFRKRLWLYVEPDDVILLWHEAAAVSSSLGCIAATLADKEACSVMVATDPLQVLEVERLLYERPCDLDSGRNNTPSELPETDAPVKCLLLFAQLLAKLAVERDQLFPVSTSLTLWDRVSLHTYIDIHSRQLAVASSLEIMPPATPGVHAPEQQPRGIGMLAPESLPRRHIVLLRSALLVLKLASLTHNVKADFLGHADSDIPAAVQALWRTLNSIAGSLEQKYKIAASHGASAGVDESAEEAEEAQRLCLLLIQLLVPVLRQCVKEPQVRLRAAACCHLLEQLLVIPTAQQMQLLASEVIRLGKPSHVTIGALVPCMTAASQGTSIRTY